MDLVTVEEIRSAAERIRGTALRTPLMPCTWGDPNRPLWLKPENIQPTGAFKIRGACAAITPAMRGVVTHSSGNHGQAVAYVARKMGIPAVIVTPTTAPEVKVTAMRDLGAEVVLVPPSERLRRAERLAAERQLVIIPPFDDPAVIAGQGTVGLEIAEDLPDVQIVLVPVGGGGLASGIGVAIRAMVPGAVVIGVEPELAADARDSLREDRLIEWPVDLTRRTVADGLRANSLSELTFGHLREVLDGIITVTEEEIRSTVGILARRSHLVAEPSGAVATAGYLYHRDEIPIGRTVAVVSGGNIDPKLFASLL
ncbi:MAG: threonine/serine dehydratase [Longispora sp.]|nr:threonine/serine dehydratase [Longispora sp. (in: high G+C Gram-positive bacteria)]